MGLYTEGGLQLQIGIFVPSGGEHPDIFTRCAWQRACMIDCGRSLLSPNQKAWIMMDGQHAVRTAALNKIDAVVQHTYFTYLTRTSAPVSQQCMEFPNKISLTAVC